MSSFLVTTRAVFLSIAFFMVIIATIKAPAQEFIPPLSLSLSSAHGLLPYPTEQLSEMALDCSHLVHYLYTQAGLPYLYAPSRELYSGARGFRRVRQPRAGDLIAWRGHVGIVVDPQQHRFLSALRSGVRVVSYSSRYWQRKGRPRFLRYALADTKALELWQRDDSLPGHTVARSLSEE